MLQAHMSVTCASCPLLSSTIINLQQIARSIGLAPDVPKISAKPAKVLSRAEALSAAHQRLASMELPWPVSDDDDILLLSFGDIDEQRSLVDGQLIPVNLITCWNCLDAGLLFNVTRPARASSARAANGAAHEKKAAAKKEEGAAATTRGDHGIEFAVYWLPADTDVLRSCEDESYRKYVRCVYMLMSVIACTQKLLGGHLEDVDHAVHVDHVNHVIARPRLTHKPQGRLLGVGASPFEVYKQLAVQQHIVVLDEEEANEEAAAAAMLAAGDPSPPPPPEPEDEADVDYDSEEDKGKRKKGGKGRIQHAEVLSALPDLSIVAGVTRFGLADVTLLQAIEVC